jgi:hypothetical protein
MTFDYTVNTFIYIYGINCSRTTYDRYSDMVLNRGMTVELKCVGLRVSSSRGHVALTKRST